MSIKGEITNIGILFSINYKLLILLFCVAFFNFLLPYFSFYKSVKVIGAEKTGIILTTTPVLSIFLSIIILGEKLTFLQAIGAVLIIIVSLLSGKKSK